jgi:type I restriction enzyme S subunit
MLEQWKKIRKNVMQKLLEGNWVKRTISDVGNVQLGRQKSPHHVKGIVTPYLRVANVFDAYIDTSDVSEMPFTEKEYENFVLQHGDILLNEGQSIELVGRCAMYKGLPENCCFQNTLIRFQAGHEVLNTFAFYVFQYYFYTGQFSAIALRTNSIAHLGGSRFAAMTMPVPPLEEQERIVAILSSFDARIRTEENYVLQLEQIKKGLMQYLLTGRYLLGAS